MVELLGRLPTPLVLAVAAMLIVAEASTLAGVVLPGTSVLAALGCLTRLGALPFAGTLAVAAAAAVAGAQLSYVQGRRREGAVAGLLAVGAVLVVALATVELTGERGLRVPPRRGAWIRGGRPRGCRSPDRS
ncbi:hypothetical protein [Microbispora bryophytorum]|uniref:DedA family protein n=1 Tax=Microbispora bryophytorum subsp. camponoti TaxID=1677852 RepID=A0ABR8LDP5_9ACTN|nr:hypothetical protein [Microbispora camponoti]MBD3146648.1 hypothetical protein [Microbispora camponoti]